MPTVTLEDNLNALIPMPASVLPTGGAFTLTPAAQIYVEPASTELAAIGQYLADKLKPATGYPLPVLAGAGAPPAGNIYLTTLNADPTLGEEGYTLTVTAEGVSLAAYQPAGLFRGLQTLRQLLPAAIESPTVQPGPWGMPGVTLRDYPRFAWRGAMLDVARHFFSVADVKHYIDLLAYYKLNRFHLHLSDDQGWRVAINTWPNLTARGASTEAGGGRGGYYTQAEYADLVAYAQRRYILLIPEIDMPGHTQAALASYAALNCNGQAPDLYTGTEVGFSSLCVHADLTYTFVDDVVRVLAALTPGPYLHLGGDEARATPTADYVHFVEKIQAIVQAHGKRLIGWEEMAQAKLLPTTVVQYWNSNEPPSANLKGTPLILSPASKTYLDMKYDGATALGQDWAGYIDVTTAYNWDPATLLSGVPEQDILGLEAPLWSETLRTRADLEYMAFPRLPGLAEVGWSPAASRQAAAAQQAAAYRRRLSQHVARLAALGVNYNRGALSP